MPQAAIQRINFQEKFNNDEGICSTKNVCWQEYKEDRKQMQNENL